MANPIPIPGPPGLPFVGNIADISGPSTMANLSNLVDTYGEMFKLRLGGGERLFISSQVLLNEICNEKRFTKKVSGALNEIRNAVVDGVFTAHFGEHNWDVAHRTLVPAFGPLSIQDMFDEMHDIASQLVAKWARFGPSQKINVTDDFTRLTLDSIAFFYKDELHPFVGAMVGMLRESGARAQRPAFASYFMRSAQRHYEADIALLNKVAEDVVAKRRANPSDKKDLLNAMLKGRDPKTGEALTDASVMNNMITFLIADHETTSGLLSFLFYYLLKNPAACQAAQRQVDEVVGRGPITVEHMNKLPYIEACLRETLRLQPPAPVFTIAPYPDTKDFPVIIGGGKYAVEKGQVMVVLLQKVHRDPAVYGDDAEDFKPERMNEEKFSKLPPNSWKPFGNGTRGCIGRSFAWQEAILSVTMLLQTFDLRFDDPSYQLQINQTLTLKPRDFIIHAVLRPNIDLVHLEKMLHVDTSHQSRISEKDRSIAHSMVENSEEKKPMTILHGSNSGTCEALAQSLARTAGARGFKVNVHTLDSATAKIPKGEPIVMISSSYEGQPPDNATHFVNWLSGLDGQRKLEGVNYVVYGCGNHDWVSTFHKVPKFLDTSFTANGAQRICNIGLGDVAAGDIFDDFDKWQDEDFWPAFGPVNEDEGDTGIELIVDTSSRRSKLRQDVKEAIVVSNEVLTATGEPEKRHILLKLPTGRTYKAGDYLAVLPINDSKNIHRVLKRFSLPWDAMLIIKSGSNTTLPTEHPLSASDVLAAYVELSQPATRRNLQRISTTIADEAQREEVARLADVDFETQVVSKRFSVLDLLEMYPTAALPLGEFLAMLPPMRIRQYSISSSPLVDPGVATMTWTVLDSPSKAAGGKRFLGVASNYLSKVESSDLVHVKTLSCHGNFHPPNDIENTPVIMLCAGSGISPFRGFVQERAMQTAAGRKLAPAYLFVGCAHPERDQLFKDEFTKWEQEGVVKLFYAYSKAKEQSKGCRYVQERLWEEREEMLKIFNQGAKMYVCGSAMVGEGVAATTKRIYLEAAEALGNDLTDEEVDEWFQKIRNDRYASDIFV